MSSKRAHCSGRWCILPDSRYVCTATTLPDLRRLRVTSDAVSKVLHLIAVPPSASIEIARSFCDVSEPGVNVLSLLHADVPRIQFLGGARDVIILLNTDVMSVEMRNCRGGVISIEVKDIPVGVYGLDDVMPPRYSPLLFNQYVGRHPPYPDLLPSTRPLLFRSSSPKGR